VALVKTACVLVHGSISKAAAYTAELVSQRLAQQPDDIAGAVGMVRSFWTEQLDATTAAGSVWRGLIATAGAIPGIEDVALYNDASQQLCKKLAKQVCPG
jgi:hypothetical protein